LTCLGYLLAKKSLTSSRKAKSSLEKSMSIKLLPS
jgi:hypothetical protein